MTTHKFKIIHNGVTLEFNGKIEEDRTAVLFPDAGIWGYEDESDILHCDVKIGRLHMIDDLVYFIEKDNPQNVTLVADDTSTFKSVFINSVQSTIDEIDRSARESQRRIADLQRPNQPPRPTCNSRLQEHRRIQQVGDENGFGYLPYGYPHMDNSHRHQKVNMLPLVTDLPNTGRHVLFGYIHNAKNPHRVHHLMMPSQTTHAQQVAITRSIFTKDGSGWEVNIDHAPILAHVDTGVSLELGKSESVNNILPSQKEHLFAFRPVDGGEWEAIR